MNRRSPSSWRRPPATRAIPAATRDMTWRHRDIAPVSAASSMRSAISRSWATTRAVRTSPRLNRTQDLRSLSGNTLFVFPVIFAEHIPESGRNAAPGLVLEDREMAMPAAGCADHVLALGDPPVAQGQQHLVAARRKVEDHLRTVAPGESKMPRWIDLGDLKRCVMTGLIHLLVPLGRRRL